MKTWNQETKDKWIAIMQEHKEHDRLKAGSWWSEDEQKGCFFGCAMQTEDEALEKAIEAMHLPAWLIYLAEKIFEGLENGSEEQLNFPVRLLKAIPVDADIEGVKHVIAIKRLQPLAEANPSVAKEINAVIELHKNWETASEKEWSDARLAAEAAVSSLKLAVNSVYGVHAAGSAKWSDALSAVRSAAGSLESAKWSDTLSAVRSAAWSAAGSVMSAAGSDALSAVRSAAGSLEAINLIEELTKLTKLNN